jgi:hypothetical protein
VLPDEARAELLDLPKLPLFRRKRGRLSAHISKRSLGRPAFLIRRRIAGRAGWLALALLVALVLASNIYFYRPRPAAIAVQTPAAPTAPSVFNAELTFDLPIPRAELVSLPAPRAELVTPGPPRALPVGGPVWNIGEDRLVRFPDGLQTLARLRGRLELESELPSVGNSLGDSWAIGDHLWLWLAEAGTSDAAWIDP